jgi:hypothetical protein
MNDILSGYDVNPATWFYLSLLLIIAVFFRFGRVWSLRNLDLALLLSMSPMLLLVRPALDLMEVGTAADDTPVFGFGMLFVVTGLLLVRVCCDGFFKRRPRLEQNLNVAGLSFLCISAFAFLMTIAVTKSPPDKTLETVRRGQSLLQLKDASEIEAPGQTEGAKAEEPQPGPASSVLAAGGAALSKAVAADDKQAEQSEMHVEVLAARIMAILAHSAVIAALVLLGMHVFGDLQIGIAMATLYLLLPCTSYDVHKVTHVLPAALILWALVAYRRPLISGGLMGLACGALFFPVFLLPLWTAFYGRRGAVRFLTSLGIVAAILLGTLALTSADLQSFATQTFGSINWGVLKLTEGKAAGFWSKYDAAYGIPVFAAYLVMLVVLTVWPRKKNLEHLISHSTALVIGTQFWYPQQGGVYMLWYLPLLLLVVFRPQLSNLLPPEPTPKNHESKDVSPKRPEPVASGPNVANQLFR